MQDKLTPRQARAWSLCALSVPAAMALPGCGWLWVLGGSILACALAACQQAMQRHSGLCMRQAFACAFGAVGGLIMAAAELLWLLFAASGAAAASQIAFEDDLGPFLPAIPLLLAALAGQKGRLAAGRVCAVLALCLAGLYAVIAAASLRHVQADWSRPQGVPALPEPAAQPPRSPEATCPAGAPHPVPTRRNNAHACEIVRHREQTGCYLRKIGPVDSLA